MKRLVVIAGIVLVLLSAAAGVVWYTGVGPFPARAGNGAGATTRPLEPVPSEAYVTLDKLVVMTRADSGQGRPRYLAMDLVFAVSGKEAAGRTTAQLPLLRSVALRTLSGYRAEELRKMDIDQIVGVLDAQFQKSYGSADAMPFSQVMIARMMLE